MDEQVLVLKNVPEEDVEETIENLERVGATSVEKTKESNGQYTLRAVFPN